jgi:hypothetical protein
MTERIEYWEFRRPIAELARRKNGLHIRKEVGWEDWYIEYGTQADVEDRVLGPDEALLDLLAQTDPVEWQFGILSDWGALSSNCFVTDDPTAGWGSPGDFEARWVYHYPNWAIESPLKELHRMGEIFLPVYIAWEDPSIDLYVQVDPASWRLAEFDADTDWYVHIHRSKQPVYDGRQTLPSESGERPDQVVCAMLNHLLENVELPSDVEQAACALAYKLKEG